MDIFEHLSLIPFLLVALGLVKIINSVSAYIKIRNQTKHESIPVKLYWVHLLFIFGLFFAFIMYWWNSHQFNDYENGKETWNLFEYILYMGIGVTLYCATDMAIPEMSANNELDLKKHYYDNARELWGLLCIVSAMSVMFSLFLYEHPLVSKETISRLILFCMLLPMVFSRNERLHKIMVFVFIATMVATIPENWELTLYKQV